jgi:glucose-6-phosphate isomerase
MQMEKVVFDYSNAKSFVTPEAIEENKTRAEKSLKLLYSREGKGNDFLGWIELAKSIGNAQLDAIGKNAAQFKEKCDIVVVIGIGGSYLGAKSVIDALSDSFASFKKNENPLIVYAGQNIGEDYLYELRNLLAGFNWGIVVISKSGTTTEPAIAFRMLKADLEAKYGKDEAKNRITAITDAEKGALRTLANQEGYETFIIPDNVGGRYSVLTPVGLLPIAIAGFDIKQLVKGAVDMENETNPEIGFENNLALQYATLRNSIYQAGKSIEIMVNYHPKLHYFAEWWKQLYGESEGKEGKGIFPASVDFTTDLHSMGQYIQDGERKLFETVLSVKSTMHKQVVEADAMNLDGLNFLAGKRVDEINKMAELGTAIAHVDGGVPNLRIEIPALNEYYLGQLIQFYETACGVSGYMLGVNPFDQPGVEDYKRNMFALLEKPGFEKETEAIKSKLK